VSNGGLKDGASISPERRAAVEAACRTWINRLIDPSRRNNRVSTLGSRRIKL
jgi:hypothetical protein